MSPEIFLKVEIWAPIFLSLKFCRRFSIVTYPLHPYEEISAEPDPNTFLGLPAKHSGVFHCLYKGKFLVSSR